MSYFFCDRDVFEIIQHAAELIIDRAAGPLLNRLIVLNPVLYSGLLVALPLARVRKFKNFF